MAPTIHTRALSKDFRIYLRKRGLLGAVGSLLSTEYRVVRAVRGLTIDIESGELVGFIGANGAGKSTTIKMLTGILHPTSGELSVCGVAPFRERKKNAARIGVVFGQRSQLLWDLPLIESFDLLRWIYGVPAERYRRNLDELVARLHVGDLLDAPVRTLSLGQRMRGDLIAALLHDPAILFLDEPTIGLDVSTRDLLLDHIQHLNRSRGTTILFTTHDLMNLERLCDRMLIIDRGRLLFDGSRTRLRNLYGTMRTLVVQYRETVDALTFSSTIPVRHLQGHTVQLEFDPERESLHALLSVLEASGTMVDVSVSQPSIESVVKRLLQDPAAGEAGAQTRRSAT